MLNSSPNQRNKEEAILVVDESASRRNKLKSSLEPEGCVVLEACSCEEALDFLARENVSLVMTETELPQNSGLYLLKEVKKHYPEVEVILITHNASSYNLLQALRNGAFDFIVRPIDTTEALHNPLKRAFNHIRKRRENVQLLEDLKQTNRSQARSLEMMKALNISVERLAVATDIEAVLKGVISSAVGELHAQRGFIALFDRASKNVGIKVSQGVSTKARKAFSVQLPQGLTVELALRGQPLLVPGVLPTELLALVKGTELKDLYDKLGLLAVPLRIKDKVAGGIFISGCSEGHIFSEYDLQFIIQLSHHAALALEKAGLIHILKRDKSASLRGGINDLNSLGVCA